MVPDVIGTESSRGRKRKRNNDGKKKAVRKKPLKLIGKYVKKDFLGTGVLLGRIVLYDSGLYRVNYEYGHSEDLTSSKLKEFLVEDGNLNGEWLERKKQLNKLLSVKDVNTKALTVDDAEVHTESNGDVDADSYGASESTPNEVSLDPPPELPPSSGHIGIPEEHVSDLLSVYSFLRSFNVRLFLYPFGLDDFVGALNCSVVNTLLDSVHVALMRVLKRHIERLLSDGSELASKILGCLDWSLFDTLTWPIYLAHYLKAMGYNNEDDWQEFYTHCVERDYYTLPVGKKLTILQILCEEVLGTEELRTEMDMRVESEIGFSTDTSSTVDTVCDPGMVHPGYSKISACKDIEVEEGLVQHRETNSSLNSHIVEPQEGKAVGTSFHEDGNGDECRLCGMDGLLICCDGCPSAYHTRCLGMSKMLMPDDSWYCPECKVNTSEPKGTTLRGGHIFGIDPYEQVFVASCDHLLVFKASTKSSNGLRYYNRRDIPGVVHSLYSRGGHAIMYSEICRGIMEHWEFSTEILPGNKVPGICLQLEIKEGNSQCNTQLVDFPNNVPQMTEFENHRSSVNGSSVHMAASKLTSVQKPDSSENSLDRVTMDDQNIVSIGQQHEILKNTITKPALLSSVIGQPADTCELHQENTSSVAEIVSSRNSDIKHNSPLNGSILEANTSLITQELDNRVDQKSNGDSHDCFLYSGSSFKITGYINHYFHGDFSASAAANLAILSCEENQAQDSGSSDNHREASSASVALQNKAFSLAATRFFWPNTEKKLVEVPRERCGWCFSCKAAVTSKKGCLLNAAASDAIRWATKLLAGFRPVKNGGDARLSGIATYIMFMEENLSGLLGGPFLNVMFRKQWRRKVEQATSCNEIKIPLLELEKNIRPIALSGDWMKLVESFSTQSSTSQTPATASESTQKHRSGRRGRKNSVMVEVAVKNKLKSKDDFTWFQGSTLSELRFQRGTLPRSIIKRSACQGGRKRIPGILYHEGGEIPRSNRQHFWRSAVEMSRNVPQLALQVRCLDSHVRWGDLVCPDQTPYNRKGPEAEASAFRNAFICNKKIVENKIRYCVAFDSQKHLPSRVMKNITEREQILDDGKERHWFSESHIPLYVIKEYEQKVEKNNSVDVLSKLQGRKLKTSGENIFSFLLWKQENKDSMCHSCHHNIFYGNAVRCSACQEFYHKQCAASSTVNLSERTESVIICKRCCGSRNATEVENVHVTPTSPLLRQGRDSPNPATKTKHVKLAGGRESSTSVGPSEHSSEVKSTDISVVSKTTRKSNWGLIWRKKNCEDTGIDFRLKNILMRGNVDKGFMNPVCRLCTKPYNADLMYICCETCKHWFHADALELDESKIFSVVGFRCCRCRRIKNPMCPYSNSVNKKPSEEKVERRRAAKPKLSKMDLDFSLISDHQNGSNAPIKNMQSLKKVSNSDGCSAKYSFRNEVSSPPSETNAVSSLASKQNVDDCLASDDTQLQRQTTILPLESDDGGHLKDNEPAEDVTENVKNHSWYDEANPIISGEIGIQTGTCKFCSKIEYSPDLCCEVCGMWVHRLCSPWIESSSDPEDECWRCGGCRDWR